VKVLIQTRRFIQTPDGHLWNRSANLGYDFWTRYLDTFDAVELLARTTSALKPPKGWHRATGDNVTAAPVPDFGSPFSLALRLPGIIRAIRDHLRAADAIILRATSDPFAPLVARLIPQGRPYGVELVGDPYDAFSPGSTTARLRALYRVLLEKETRRLIARSAAASYVTEEVLQRRYPPPVDGFTTHYSSIDLPEEALAPKPRPFDAPLQGARLTIVGTLQQLFKAQDVVIDAVGALVREGWDMRLNVIGDGVHRKEMEQRAVDEGIGERVIFHGHIDPDRVRDILDNTDIFVLPSRHEGLPRAMIEAMARGLPAIGSTIAGFPELVSRDALVPPGDVKALADLLRAVMGNPSRLTDWAKANHAHARDYLMEPLQRRRRELFQFLMDETGRWKARIT